MSAGWIILLVLGGWFVAIGAVSYLFALLGNVSRLADCVEVWVNLELAREEGQPEVPTYPPPEFRDQ